jgi:predicted nucleic acid-binding protein
MSVKALLDTGPLVAYFIRSEANHAWAVETFKQLRRPALTCEAVIAEACFLLGRRNIPPARVVTFLRRGDLEIGLGLGDEAGPVLGLIERYANVPMSLADACLVRLAEMTGLPVCTLDSDFMIYRAHGRTALDLISPMAYRSLHEP